MRNNLRQGVGWKSAQYEQAIANVDIIIKNLGFNNLILAGHSLGGGLSSVSGTIYHIETITFNAAGVHWRTLARHYTTIGESRFYVTAYRSKGEILTFEQESRRGTRFIPDAIGQKITYPYPVSLPNPPGRIYRDIGKSIHENLDWFHRWF